MIYIYIQQLVHNIVLNKQKLSELAMYVKQIANIIGHQYYQVVANHERFLVYVLGTNITNDFRTNITNDFRSKTGTALVFNCDLFDSLSA